jgi:hypothetical protein
MVDESSIRNFDIQLHLYDLLHYQKYYSVLHKFHKEYFIRKLDC